MDRDPMYCLPVRSLGSVVAPLVFFFWLDLDVLTYFLLFPPSLWLDGWNFGTFSRCLNYVVSRHFKTECILEPKKKKGGME